MYGFPDPDALRFIVNRQLESVLLSAHSAVFDFADGVRITVEGSVRTKPSMSALKPRELGSLASRLIGESITKLARPEGKLLVTNWTNGDVVELLDDKENFETFRFWAGDSEVAV